MIKCLIHRSGEDASKLFTGFSLSFFGWILCIKCGMNVLLRVNSEPSQTPLYCRPINLFRFAVWKIETEFVMDKLVFSFAWEDGAAG